MELAAVMSLLTWKSFRVPNPNDVKTDIWYASIEGPEAAAYLRGTARLNNGRAFIPFPNTLNRLPPLME